MMIRYERLNKPESTHSFGIFRILFFLHTLFLWYYTYLYRIFEFNAFPGFAHQILSSQMMMFIWLVSIFMMLTGTLTRYSAIVNYLCVLVISEVNGRVGAATFYNDLLKMGSLLCIFLPVSKSFSMDTLMSRIATRNLLPKHTNYLNYLWTVIITLGLMYLGAAISKMASPIWMSGLGLWLPLSLPYMMYAPISQTFVNQEYLMYALNYLVIIWELAFIFLLFYKRCHVFLIITGVIFHLLIAYYFNFPRTSIGVCFFYILLVPHSFWMRLHHHWIQSSSKTTVFVPSTPSYQKIQALIFSLDFRNKFEFTTIPEQATIHPKSILSMVYLLKQYVIFQPILILLRFKLISDKAKTLFYAINQNYSPTNTLFKTSLNRNIFMVFSITIIILQFSITARHITNKITSKGQKPKLEFGSDMFSSSRLKFNIFSMSNVFLGVNSRALFMDRTYGDTAKKFTLLYTDNSNQSHFILHDSSGFAYNDLNLQCEWTKINYNIAIARRQPQKEGVNKVIREWFRIRNLPLDSQANIKILLRTYPTASQFEENYYTRMLHVPLDTIGNVAFNGSSFDLEPYP